MIGRHRSKAQRLVEPRRRRVARAQAQRAEAAARGADDLRHQRAAHAEPARGVQHVEMADAPDPIVARVGIDVEPTHTDQPPVDAGTEDRLARTVEGVGAVAPLVDELPHEAQAGLLALSHEQRELGRAKITQALAANLSKPVHTGRSRPPQFGRGTETTPIETKCVRIAANAKPTTSRAHRQAARRSRNPESWMK